MHKPRALPKLTEAQAPPADAWWAIEEDVLDRPRDPYTSELLSNTPTLTAAEATG